MNRNVRSIDRPPSSIKEERTARTLFVAADSTAGRHADENGEYAIVGHSRKLEQMLQQVAMVAPTDSTVLILGESGAGKELVARRIHQQSTRARHAFVQVNCAAIPLGLLESELFGHERGAFTGAIAQRAGRFELADNGTLFLDEIGDIPLELQPKLLRVLQEQEFERLGSSRTIHTNVRVIAATHRQIDQMIENGTFRMDLYYRLNVFPIRVPPLRERPDDIPALAWYFTTKFARRMGRQIETIPPHVMEALTRHRWTGNVRELQNLIERAVILSHGPVLEAPIADLDAQVGTAPPVTFRDAERAHIVRTLRDAGGVVADAAALLGVPRTTLFYKMRRLGIRATAPRATP